MRLVGNGNVELKCKDCGVVFQVHASTYLHSTTQERLYCKQCIKKKREQKGRWRK